MRLSISIGLLALLLCSGCEPLRERVCGDGYSRNDTGQCVSASEDAGTDAASDAGFDAGFDAGPCARCGGDTPHCTDEGTCVMCLQDEHCGDQVCDPSTKTCVDCVTHDDCPDSAAAQCSANRCAPCELDAHCASAREDDVLLPVCDTSRGGGTCVQCNPGTEEDDCENDSCDPATGRCSPYRAAEQARCEPCVSDSDCASPGVCVAMDYMGTALGGFCLWPAASCPDAYRTRLSSVMTLSGRTATGVCTVNQMLTTCDATLAFIRGVTCGGDTECAPPAGLCRPLAGTSSCTYRCSIDGHCPAGIACNTAVEPQYCGD